MSDYIVNFEFQDERIKLELNERKPKLERTIDTYPFYPQSQRIARLKKAEKRAEKADRRRREDEESIMGIKETDTEVEKKGLQRAQDSKDSFFLENTLESDFEASGFFDSTKTYLLKYYQENSGLGDYSALFSICDNISEESSLEDIKRAYLLCSSAVRLIWEVRKSSQYSRTISVIAKLDLMDIDKALRTHDEIQNLWESRLSKTAELLLSKAEMELDSVHSKDICDAIKASAKARVEDVSRSGKEVSSQSVNPKRQNKQELISGFKIEPFETVWKDDLMHEAWMDFDFNAHSYWNLEVFLDNICIYEGYCSSTDFDVLFVSKDMFAMADITTVSNSAVLTNKLEKLRSISVPLPRLLIVRTEDVSREVNRCSQIIRESYKHESGLIEKQYDVTRKLISMLDDLSMDTEQVLYDNLPSLQPRVDFFKSKFILNYTPFQGTNWDTSTIMNVYNSLMRRNVHFNPSLIPPLTQLGTLESLIPLLDYMPTTYRSILKFILDYESKKIVIQNAVRAELPEFNIYEVSSQHVTKAYDWRWVLDKGKVPLRIDDNLIERDVSQDTLETIKDLVSGIYISGVFYNDAKLGVVDGKICTVLSRDTNDLHRATMDNDGNPIGVIVIIPISSSEFQLFATASGMKGIFRSGKGSTRDEAFNEVIIERNRITRNGYEVGVNPSHNLTKEDSSLFSRLYDDFKQVFESDQPKCKILDKLIDQDDLRAIQEISKTLVRVQKLTKDSPAWMCYFVTEHGVIISSRAWDEENNYHWMAIGKMKVDCFERWNPHSNTKLFYCQEKSSDLVLVCTKFLNMTNESLLRHITAYDLFLDGSKALDLQISNVLGSDPQSSSVVPYEIDETRSRLLASIIGQMSIISYMTMLSPESLILQTMRYAITSCFCISISFEEIINKLKTANISGLSGVCALAFIGEMYDLRYKVSKFLKESDNEPSIQMPYFCRIAEMRIMSDDGSEKLTHYLSQIKIPPSLILELCYIQSLYQYSGLRHYRYDHCCDVLDLSRNSIQSRESGRFDCISKFINLYSSLNDSEKLSPTRVREILNSVVDKDMYSLENYIKLSKKERMFKGNPLVSMIVVHFNLRQAGFVSFIRAGRESLMSLALQSASREFKELTDSSKENQWFFRTLNSSLAHVRKLRSRLYSKFDLLYDVMKGKLVSNENIVGTALKDQAGGNRVLSILTVIMRTVANFIEMTVGDIPTLQREVGNCVAAGDKFYEICRTVNDSLPAKQDVSYSSVVNNSVEIPCPIRVTIDMSSWGDNIEVCIIYAMLLSICPSLQAKQLTNFLFSYYDSKSIMMDNKTTSEFIAAVNGFAKFASSKLKNQEVFSPISSDLRKFGSESEMMSWFFDSRNRELLSSITGVHDNIESLKILLRTPDCDKNGLLKLLQFAERPCFKMPNGMMQGILQKSSSVYHLLSMGFIESKLNHRYRNRLRITSRFCTSDDAFFSVSAFINLEDPMKYIFDKSSVIEISKLAKEGSSTLTYDPDNLLEKQLSALINLVHPLCLILHKRFSSTVIAFEIYRFITTGFIGQELKRFIKISKFKLKFNSMKWMTKARKSYNYLCWDIQVYYLTMHWLLNNNMNLAKSGASSFWAELNSYQFLFSPRCALYCPPYLKLTYANRLRFKDPNILSSLRELHSTSYYMLSAGFPVSLVDELVKNRAHLVTTLESHSEHIVTDNMLFFLQSQLGMHHLIKRVVNVSIAAYRNPEFRNRNKHNELDLDIDKLYRICTGCFIIPPRRQRLIDIESDDPGIRDLRVRQSINKNSSSPSAMFYLTDPDRYIRIDSYVARLLRFTRDTIDYSTRVKLSTFLSHLMSFQIELTEEEKITSDTLYARLYTDLFTSQNTNSSLCLLGTQPVMGFGRMVTATDLIPPDGIPYYKEKSFVSYPRYSIWYLLMPSEQAESSLQHTTAIKTIHSSSPNVLPWRTVYKSCSLPPLLRDNALPQWRGVTSDTMELLDSNSEPSEHELRNLPFSIRDGLTSLKELTKNLRDITIRDRWASWTMHSIKPDKQTSVDAICLTAHKGALVDNIIRYYGNKIGKNLRLWYHVIIKTSSISEVKETMTETSISLYRKNKGLRLKRILDQNSRIVIGKSDVFIVTSISEATLLKAILTGVELNMQRSSIIAETSKLIQGSRVLLTNDPVLSVEDKQEILLKLKQNQELMKISSQYVTLSNGISYRCQFMKDSFISTYEVCNKILVNRVHQAKLPDSNADSSSDSEIIEKVVITKEQADRSTRDVLDQVTKSLEESLKRAGLPMSLLTQCKEQGLGLRGEIREGSNTKAANKAESSDEYKDEWTSSPELFAKMMNSIRRKAICFIKTHTESDDLLADLREWFKEELIKYGYTNDNFLSQVTLPSVQFLSKPEIFGFYIEEDGRLYLTVSDQKMSDDIESVSLIEQGTRKFSSSRPSFSSCFPLLLASIFNFDRIKPDLGPENNMIYEIARLMLETGVSQYDNIVTIDKGKLLEINKRQLSRSKENFINRICISKGFAWRILESATSMCMIEKLGEVNAEEEDEDLIIGNILSSFIADGDFDFSVPTDDTVYSFF